MFKLLAIFLKFIIYETVLAISDKLQRGFHTLSSVMYYTLKAL